MEITIKVHSLAELAAVGAMIRGDELDDATVAKLHRLTEALRRPTDALKTALEGAPPA